MLRCRSSLITGLPDLNSNGHDIIVTMVATLNFAENLSSGTSSNSEMIENEIHSDRANTLEDDLLAAIRSDQGLPALGASIAQIIHLSSSDDESIRKLTYFVLSDVSLTQKILRLSNSVSFRTASNKAITSVSKAIFLLGFNTVKTCALAVLLVDGLSEKKAKHVRHELIYALATSMICRELARRSRFSDAEEVAVAALFKNIGRLLLAVYYPELYQKITALIQQGSQTPSQAYRQILRFDLDNFAEKVMQEWEIPKRIINTLTIRPVDIFQPPKSRLEWMQQVVEFSHKTVPLILSQEQPFNTKPANTLLDRFGKALDLNKVKLNALITHAANETKAFEINVGLSSPDQNREIRRSPETLELNLETEEHLLKELAFAFEQNEETTDIQRYPSGKPYNAAKLLLTGIQDATEIMASGRYQLSDLITLVLETFYNSLGFRFITLCLRDQERGLYRARSSLGSNYLGFQKAFTFPLAASTDLFHLAMKQNVDLIISDASIGKVRNLQPQWHLDLLPDARSFIVLPLVLNEKRIGLLYADRLLEAPEGISSEEMRLIKTLKAQVITALHTR
ncbi:HD-like signal output (HDOD) domain, no enzymatic activity [Nitrosomonas marina]|uniref:HD-like signal output (HDOD) domain, no enzymatic activity n=2 Tax=Nitrosomonas marina TaxID=917 RepID=A0A1I0FQ55_9PROT|nr:HD-like signal output (HDOD) domain, no enzymatic activity [Nitrosomonas marina]